jgi:peptidoglycan/LPS O-acetylase OafA/YrhL
VDLVTVTEYRQKGLGLPVRVEQVAPPAKRGDIQGLRALAILFVVAYHAGVPHVSGGFVGVDLFFVLSGFLITQLMLREIATTGTVSLRRFWARRARRIIPASALVLVATMLAVRAFISPLERKDIAVDALWSALFSGNWRFAQQETDYLASDRNPSPVLHYWSLGVEEQFYFVWPLVLVALAAIWRLSRRNPTVHVVAFGTTFVGVIVFSLAYCIHVTTTHQPYAFFGTPARAWQLAAGALTALAVPVILRWRHGTRATLGVAGLTLLGLSVYVLEESGSADIPYPSWLALAPTLAGVLLLVSGTGSYSWLSRVLSLRPLTYVGDLSYSLYLWHWPVLIIGVEAVGARTPEVRLGLVALACAFSVASYHLVENPIRRAAILVKRPALSIAVGATLVVAVIPAVAYASETESIDTVVVAPSDPPRSSVDVAKRPAPAAHLEKVRPALDEAFDDAFPLKEKGCHVEYDATAAPPWDGCTFADTRADRRVVVIGDSIAGAIAPALIKAGEQEGWAVTAWAKSRCPMGDVTKFEAEHGGVYDECDAFRESVLREIVQRRPDVVVIAMSRGSATGLAVGGRRVVGPAAAERSAKGLQRTVDRLREAGIGVVLSDSPNRSPFLTTSCLAKKRDVGKCTFRAAQRTSVMQTTAREMGDRVTLVEPNATVCREGTCYPVVGDIVVYRDKVHYTATFAKTLSGEYVDGIEQALRGG